jgi:hypothetical protein
MADVLEDTRAICTWFKMTPSVQVRKSADNFVNVMITHLTTKHCQKKQISIEIMGLRPHDCQYYKYDTQCTSLLGKYLLKKLLKDLKNNCFIRNTSLAHGNISRAATGTCITPHDNGKRANTG